MVGGSGYEHWKQRTLKWYKYQPGMHRGFCAAILCRLSHPRVRTPCFSRSLHVFCAHSLFFAVIVVFSSSRFPAHRCCCVLFAVSCYLCCFAFISVVSLVSWFSSFCTVALSLVVREYCVEVLKLLEIRVATSSTFFSFAS